MIVERFAARMSRDKANTLLLVTAAVLVLAPHALHQPWWVTLTAAATLGWRSAVTFRGWRLPPTLILLPATFAAMGGILWQFHTLLGRDAGVAMLTMLVAFKMLEMHAKRDLFVVIYLCFFLILTNFLYSQTMGTAAMMVLSLTFLLTAQLSFQFTGAMPSLARRMRMVGAMLVLAVPLTLVLFIVFPRIQGPLWGMPGSSGSGTTGLSDTMAPGKLSSLAQSDDPAFRVRFLDPMPPQHMLYWRAVVLGHYDGQTWTRASVPRSQQVQVHLRGRPIRHEITMEPSSARWLFALDLPRRPPQVPGYQVQLTPALELQADEGIRQRVRYEALSYPAYVLQPSLAPTELGAWTQLPARRNPRTLAWGAQLAALPAPSARARAVLSAFRSGGYRYTLQPPLLPGADSIDDFLFGTKAGFCEHYAGAFVIVMRAAGVPARVVTGYQGGELNPLDNYLTVRQSDAHAWAEIWLAGAGWVRVDPTAAVAPDRIEHGLARTQPRQAPFGIEGLRNLIDLSDAQSMLGRLRLTLAAINNGWNQWVLNYTPERQRGVLDTITALFGNPLALAALAGAVVLGLALRALHRRGRRDQVDALYSALCRRLAQRGLARRPDEGPTAFAARVRSGPDTLGNREAILRFLLRYSEYKYGPAAPDPARVATMKTLFRHTR